jgi:metallo-beta-lactamase family protein
VPDQLGATMVPVLERGGVVVIPAFAVGRTSILLYHIRRMQDRGAFPDVPVIVDSPMAVDSAKIYQRYCREHNLQLEDAGGSGCLLNPRQTRFLRKPEESKRLNELDGPAVIISASGMMTGGRILHHVRARGSDPRNLILLVGYQAEGTRGRALLEGKRELKMFGELVAVKAQVAAIQGMSAHGDSDDVAAWLKTADPAPKKVFLVHGEAEGLRAMSERIVSELGFPCHTPKYLEAVEL